MGRLKEGRKQATVVRKEETNHWMKTDHEHLIGGIIYAPLQLLQLSSEITWPLKKATFSTDKAFIMRVSAEVLGLGYLALLTDYSSVFSSLCLYEGHTQNQSSSSLSICPWWSPLKHNELLWVSVSFTFRAVSQIGVASAKLLKLLCSLRRGGGASGFYS